MPTPTQDLTQPASAPQSASSPSHGSAPSPAMAWRDLQPGEVLQAGDRMLSRSLMLWNVWTAQEIAERRPIVIDKHTLPAQRLVVLPNTETRERGQPVPPV